MTNKNPFEIRLDVLKMAQDMVERELQLKNEQYLQSISEAKETNLGAVKGIIHNESPKMYTPEDVIAKASALYNFVSDSSYTRTGQTPLSTREKHRK